MTSMIRIDRDRHVNPAYVAFLEWDHRHYMNGSSSALIITMHDGSQHRVRDESHYMGGADPFAVERAILAAIEAGCQA